VHLGHAVKADYRAVLVLRHFEDLSYDEIGTVLGIPEKTVKSRLFTARQLLRERLSARGILR
jgi:RNA polymerase sigma-70 factor (ECF subfamily)